MSKTIDQSVAAKVAKKKQKKPSNLNTTSAREHFDALHTEIENNLSPEQKESRELARQLSIAAKQTSH